MKYLINSSNITALTFKTILSQLDNINRSEKVFRFDQTVFQILSFEYLECHILRHYFNVFHFCVFLLLNIRRALKIKIIICIKKRSGVAADESHLLISKGRLRSFRCGSLLLNHTSQCLILVTPTQIFIRFNTTQL